MVPEKLLHRIMKTMRSERLPISDGILPVKPLHPSIAIVSKQPSTQYQHVSRSFPKETSALLELCLNLLNRPKFPISVGMLPVILPEPNENTSVITTRESKVKYIIVARCGIVVIVMIKVVAYLVLRAVLFLLAPNLQGSSFLRHRMKLLKSRKRHRLAPSVLLEECYLRSGKPLATYSTQSTSQFRSVFLH